MYTPFANAFAYAIKQTPYAFVAKIILCMYLLYDLMPLLMDVLKCHISYQFKSKFEKLNKYSFANNFFMGIGIALYHPFTEFIW